MSSSIKIRTFAWSLFYFIISIVVDNVLEILVGFWIAKLQGFLSTYF